MTRAAVAMRAIEAQGLTLEPQCVAHASEMFGVLGDSAIYRYENEPPPSLDWLRGRFARLESRLSPDGSQQWLNWVVRLPSGELAGYVQATLHADGRAVIAYVLASRYWGQGLASRAVQAMIGELRDAYGVHTLTAVLKRDNGRSLRLLERLGFGPGTAGQRAAWEVPADELLMVRDLRDD